MDKKTGEQRTFYEFFAGGGMARAGLGDGWACVFANDFDPMKAAAYVANWGDGHFVAGDIANISTKQLPGAADLAWASFPCQDLSLAGDYKGLGWAGDNVRTRSGTFWLFHDKIRALKKLGRHPRTIVLENVHGTLTSNNGNDFTSIVTSIAGAGYKLGSLAIDARRFIPQSRPRVFFIAVRNDLRIPADIIAAGPDAAWHPPALLAAHKRLTSKVAQSWIWWRVPLPAPFRKAFGDVVEDNPTGVDWHAPAETAHILGLMTDVNTAKIVTAKKAGKRLVGTIYRRTRPDQNGVKRQRAEVRFDGVAGCLRTPAGGSSRQSIIVVESDLVRTRLLSPREAARLMGLPDTYKLPIRYNDAYHLCGDGVVIPVVRHLASNLLEPILEANPSAVMLAAE